MTKYETELASLRPHDPPQMLLTDYGYPGVCFIETAGHGFLVVPKGHPKARLARSLCAYGYLGRHAIYLEEDCEARDFIKQAHNH